MDRLMVNARLPLAEDEEIHSLKMMVFLRARLRVRGHDGLLFRRICRRGNAMRCGVFCRLRQFVYLNMLGFLKRRWGFFAARKNALGVGFFEGGCRRNRLLPIFRHPVINPMFQDRAKVEMDALAYVEHAGPLAGGSVEVDGDLRMRQTWPLSLYGGRTTASAPRGMGACAGGLEFCFELHDKELVKHVQLQNGTTNEWLVEQTAPGLAVPSR